MASYTFRFPADLAGADVTVTDVKGGTVTTGTLDGAATFTTSLPEGTYTGVAKRGSHSFSTAADGTSADPDDTEFARQIGIPGSATQAALSATYVGAKPAGFLDAAPLADGAVPALATGQAVTSFGNSPASVSGGKITHTPSAGTNKAAYLQADIGSGVTEIGCVAEFPASDAGSIAFVLPLAAWASGSLTQAGVHFVMQGDGKWHVSTWNGTAESPIYYSGKVAALGDGKRRKIVLHVDRDNSTLTVLLPDGTTSPVISHANIAALTSTFALWELFEADTATGTPPKLHAIWANGSATNTDRSRPRFGDLIKALAAQEAGDVAFVKEAITEPTGTTTSNVLTSAVELVRVTIKRPPSGKVKASLNVFLGVNAPCIALAWFGYVQQNAASSGSDYTKAVQIVELPAASTHKLNQAFAGEVLLTIPAATTVGTNDTVDVIACVRRSSGNDGDLKYRINDGAGQRAVLTVVAAA